MAGQLRERHGGEWGKDGIAFGIDVENDGIIGRTLFGNHSPIVVELVVGAEDRATETSESTREVTIPLGIYLRVL